MHPTTLFNCQNFFDTYSDAFQGADTRVIEIGSQDVNGSLRTCCPERFGYVGVDFVSGEGVDVVLEDPYSLPFATASIDIVLTSSCLEHSEMFWLVFLEAMRILKPHGLLYLNVPSNGAFHRYPVDCWRFYPDSGHALVTWGRRNGLNPALLESYISEQVGDIWNDYVAVFVKDQSEANRYKSRILTGREDLSNGLVLDARNFVNLLPMPEDIRKLSLISQIINNAPPVHDDQEKLALIKMIINNEVKLR